MPRMEILIDVSDDEFLSRLAEVKEKQRDLNTAVARLESCVTSRFEQRANIATGKMVPTENTKGTITD